MNYSKIWKLGYDALFYHIFNTRFWGEKNVKVTIRANSKVWNEVEVFLDELNSKFKHDDKDRIITKNDLVNYCMMHTLAMLQNKEGYIDVKGSIDTYIKDRGGLKKMRAEYEEFLKPSEKAKK